MVQNSPFWYYGPSDDHFIGSKGKIWDYLGPQNGLFGHEIPLGAPGQSSYLSQISQITSVEKNLSCGEFEQFMEFLSKFMPFLFKSVWRKI